MFLNNLQNSREGTCVGIFFNKVAGPQNFNFIKKRLKTGFSSEFCELSMNTYFAEDPWTVGCETPVRFFKNAFFTERLQWLLLAVSGFQHATLLKKRLEQRYLSVNFGKFLRTSFDRTPPNDSSLCFMWILRSFSVHPFYRAPLENCLFHVQVAEFQPPHTVKKYFASAFQAFYTRRSTIRRRSCKPLKTICEEVRL